MKWDHPDCPCIDIIDIIRFPKSRHFANLGSLVLSASCSLVCLMGDIAKKDRRTLATARQHVHSVSQRRRVPKKANVAEKNGCAKEMDMQTASIVFFWYVIYIICIGKGILVAWLGKMNCKCCLPEHGKGVRVPSPSIPAVQERTHFGAVPFPRMLPTWWVHICHVRSAIWAALFLEFHFGQKQNLAQTTAAHPSGIHPIRKRWVIPAYGQDFSALIRPRNPDRWTKWCPNDGCWF